MQFYLFIIAMYIWLATKNKCHMLSVRFSGQHEDYYKRKL